MIEEQSAFSPLPEVINLQNLHLNEMSQDVRMLPNFRILFMKDMLGVLLAAISKPYTYYVHPLTYGSKT